MRKLTSSFTLTDETNEIIEELAELLGTNKSQAAEAAFQFIGKNYLSAAVVVFVANGHEMKDGRYKDGIVPTEDEDD